MKYRVVARVFSAFNLIESSFGLAIVGLFTSCKAYVLLRGSDPGHKLFSVCLLILISLFIGRFCYRCIDSDAILLKATEKETPHRLALELCEWSLSIAIPSFWFKIITLISALIAEFMYNFPSYYSRGDRQFLFIPVQILMPLLFPGLSGTMIYFSECSTYWDKFSNCSIQAIQGISIIVIFRMVSLYSAVKYTEELKQTLIEASVAYSVNRIESSSSNSRSSYVRYTPGEVRINNFVPSVCVERHETILLPSSIREHPKVKQLNDDLPTYADVAESNPPSYDDIFNNISK